ncbi:protein ALTERED PHOSPHATE STARVATION RESPONSE 1-like [Arachis stenosperma]|uniref:protein ALTERED PHOSPHATE STARVATION RESPONSE 1-like n=1 Tax=Arachis stenosperma TaxID=217475 RepID=UPI0025AB8F4F|nr:protein ALTERED PHOSPHATE STARVATION RESPONSE 1-like [Arachis stenosperma]
MWEKKLYDEVKGEEKLRIIHQNKCRQLRRISKTGADAHKIDSLETMIALLATKMKISFQVVDNISNTICDLREHQLWPHISTFLFRFLRMWKDMLECYKRQCRQIAEARSLDTSFNEKLSNSHLYAAIKLKSEIKNWTLSFSDWIYAQKSHVKALNGWLVRCLMHDLEETTAVPPFSSGGIGAPPLFVICSKWSRAMDDLSEKEMVEAVNRFILRVNEILDKHISDPRQKATLDKELERQVKILERQEQKMHKVIQSREIKMGRGDAVHRGELLAAMSLQSGLQHIFAAMERFTASATRAYEQLCQQIEPDNHLSGDLNNIH